MGNPLLIAVDGPAASGKGTLARRVAEHLGAVYLDTGKLYRAVGYALIKSGKNVDAAADFDSDSAKYAASSAENLDISALNNQDLSLEEVGRAASFVSAIPAVRKALLKFQRDVAKNPKGAVIDGRDIGTVVCPEANPKFFITASLETRAKRRFIELQKRDNGVIYDSVLQDLKARDERDSKRKISPLKPANDAIHIDTSNMSIDDVFNKVLSVILSSTS